MINFLKYRCILWDFDGVLMDSMHIRDEGFRRVLAEYPQGQIDHLMIYHRKNGGLSRYVKFRYFFETIRGESITESQIKALADQFSKVMMELLVDSKLLITDSLRFVKSNDGRIPMHIVSGSDEKELKEVCKRLEIARFFVSIHGSPEAKASLIAKLLSFHGYDPGSVVMIGDSINDKEAALKNGIQFIGYNNLEFDNEDHLYVHSFAPFLSAKQE
jgi:phosphoglycolate phosphatase-like HAD superfamily hydrolase